MSPLIQKAIPSVIQQSIPAISTTSLTALVSTYSVTAIAAYGVTGKLETILFYPAMTLNMVLTTIIGQCAGGARYDRAKDYLKCALFLQYSSYFSHCRKGLTAFAVFCLSIFAGKKGQAFFRYRLPFSTLSNLNVQTNQIGGKENGI